MIILARPVAYGGNAARYAMEKEDATVVKVNHMPDYLDATEIWYRMKHHCQLHQQDRTVGRKLERFMTTFVLSPSKEESENYTLDDWANLADEGLEALDSVGLLPKGFKEKVKTNFRNSMSVAALHRDSKSGTLHLHLDCCRVDNDGKTNDVHDVHIRAIRAAEIINARHGWEQPQEVREMRQQDIAEFCEYTLQKMDSFDIDRYPVAGLGRSDGRADSFYDTHRFVADRNARYGARHAAVLDMQVAGADTAQRYAHNGIARIFQLRLRFVQQLELSSFDISIGLHG